MPHSTIHPLLTAALAATSIALMLVVRSRVIRRRLLFSAVAALGATAVHLLAAWRPESWLWGSQGRPLELLIVAVAMTNAVVVLLFNPWFRDGESDRAPAIVQDALVAGVGLVVGLVLFHVSSFNFLTGSAIVAAVVGFALQDTLGNAFAGIAIQIERPFRVGHWITVGDSAGLVTEMTWRSTRIRTKSGNVVSVPNSVMSNHVITNYSEPAVSTRLSVDVGADYGVPPNIVREALLSAARDAASVLPSPSPDVVLAEFGSSAIVYRLVFWVADFTRDEQARSAVRTRIYYEFHRRGIAIPWPIQVQYERQEALEDPALRLERWTRAIAGAPLLAKLSPDTHRALANSARELLFTDGEAVVREETTGESMFLVLAGRVVISVGPERMEVAVTEAGGYFGEMSLLTGEPRTATVSARGDCTLLEIRADAFGAFVRERPEVIDELAHAASARRRELDDVRAAAGPLTATATASLSARMREFFGIG